MFNENAPRMHVMSTAVPSVPDALGHFGPYGGTFVPETLVAALEQLRREYDKAKNDPAFDEEFQYYLREYVGRPSRLYFAKRLTEKWGGAKVYLKREDLNHTGAHKINNTIGQALLTKRMDKPRIIAETGAGMHGVATATVGALFDLKTDVFMGAEDVRRQSLNVFRMKQMGANVIEVHSGSKTLKDALNEALRDWMGSVQDTHYIIGSVAGPHPFPMMVRDFQVCIGRETRQQCVEAEGRLPDVIVACVGGGSNAAGIFYPFIADAEAIDAFQQVARLEGILVALESAHAFAQTAKIAPTMSKDQILVINCSGRGDKDCQEVARLIQK